MKRKQTSNTSSSSNFELLLKLVGIPSNRVHEMNLTKTDLQRIMISYKRHKNKIGPAEGGKIRSIIEYWVREHEMHDQLEKMSSELQDVVEEQEFQNMFPRAPTYIPSPEVFQLQKDIKTYKQGKEKILKMLRALGQKHNLHQSWIEYLERCFDMDIENTKKRIQQIKKKRKKKGGGKRLVNTH